MRYVISYLNITKEKRYGYVIVILNIDSNLDPAEAFLYYYHLNLLMSPEKIIHQLKIILFLLPNSAKPLL